MSLSAYYHLLHLTHSSLTEPEAFYLDVYFNAHLIHPDSKDKQRALNALVPTSISYPGGLMDFTVDMGTEVRLSIFVLVNNII